MTKFFIISGYIKQCGVAKYLVMGAALCLLSGCLGGTVAQQIVRTIATNIADKTVANAMGVDEDQDYSDAQYAASEKLSSENNAVQRNFMQSTGAQSISPQIVNKRTMQLQQTEPDEFSYMLATASFMPVKPIAEPLPALINAEETPVKIVQANQLVRVELFNLLIGEEKTAMYEEARLLGTTSLPNKQAWKNWQVGIGAIEHSKKIITFLIPPEFGKLPSGTITIVEIAGAGELNIARYDPDNSKYKRLATIRQAQGF